MNKYEEALKVVSQYNPSMEYVQAVDVLKEAVDKAEKYDELNNLVVYEDKPIGYAYAYNLVFVIKNENVRGGKR